MAIKFAVAALLSTVLFASCASEPAKPPTPNLLKTEWLLEDLGGKGVVDGAQATLAFPEEDKVAGNGSCNRFFGSVAIKGDTISFGQMGSTLMACWDEAVAKQESNYLNALKNAERISLEGPHLLIYARGLDKPLRFTQITPKSQP